MTSKTNVKAFISYAHKDRKYFKALVEGLKVHSKNSIHFNWEIWDDREIVLGEEWDEQIQQEVKKCDFAVLLISANFLSSPYIKKDEFENFVLRQKNDGFLFFPVLISDCEFSNWENLSRIQFFLPAGEDYGYPKLGEKPISYDRLIHYDTEGVAHHQPSIHTYHKNFVKKIELALKKKVNSIFNTSKNLIPEKFYLGCNRTIQFQDLQYILEISTKKPCMCILYGNREDCHRSLIERFYYYLLNKGKYVVIPLINIGKWDVRNRKERIIKSSFEAFNLTDIKAVPDNAQMIIDSYNQKCDVLLIEIEIDCNEQKWNNNLKSTLKWYINEFWNVDTQNLKVLHLIKLVSKPSNNWYFKLFDFSERRIEKDLRDLYSSEIRFKVLPKLSPIKKYHVKELLIEKGLASYVDKIDKLFLKKSEITMLNFEMFVTKEFLNGE
ncbi:TIR domain-containing protein [Flexithrix dorotheae]|uniref:TIR domain-containing protein n=1 Tax=Flexithrix dorotheae TaxID=70993 RepID=UPI00036B888B|nr:TIR domain-containing protein [Flexithrix dorotheae]